MTVPIEPRRIIFADVDGTLIRGSSLLDFMLFDAQARKVTDAAEALVQSVREAAAAGVPRSQTARSLYSWWANRAVSEVFAAAEDWVRMELRSNRGRFLHQAVIDEITAHRRAGAALVFVSASFDAPLAALAGVLGAADILCTPMVTADECYTGAAGAPMVGERKAAAVRCHLAGLGTEPVRSIAYGDHGTDLEMLAAVDEPVAISDGLHSPLAAEAGARGWRIIRVVGHRG